MTKKLIKFIIPLFTKIYRWKICFNISLNLSWHKLLTAKSEPLDLSLLEYFVFGFEHTEVDNCLPGCKVARISLFPATSASDEALSYMWIRNLSVCCTATGETATCRTTISTHFCPSIRPSGSTTAYFFGLLQRTEKKFHFEFNFYVDRYMFHKDFSSQLSGFPCVTFKQYVHVIWII